MSPVGEFDPNISFTVPDLGEVTRRQNEINERFAEMEQEIEIFRRVLAMALQKLGGTLVVTDDDMLGWEWEHNTLEMEASELEPQVTITSFQV
jgi:hypothetical protein